MFTRPLSRTFARQLSGSEIDLVAGGPPPPGNHATICLGSEATVCGNADAVITDDLERHPDDV